ncbi:MAG: SH3 domain-containing protein [Clostridiales bacterium]|jgi:uncharacterized protein YgiM (DUF1202 family)|nr:SH3 domain-containing protein [Clostridiales bacterium]
MNKWISILLILCLSFSLFGCGKDEPEETSVSPSEEPQIIEEPTPEPEPVYILIGTVYDVDTFLNIRSGPGTNYDVIGRAYANEKFTVITEYYTEDWHQVEYDGGIAYIHADYLIVQEVLDESAESAE